jgi:hypothetical protein
MAQTSIFGPFFATMLLTLLVWMYMYIRRIRFITKNNINPKDLTVPGALAQLSPAAVSNPSDNLKNLFEIPVLFYALALYLFVTNQVDAAYVSAAWIFVAFRALHIQPSDVAVLPLPHRQRGDVVHDGPGGARALRRLGTQKAQSGFPPGFSIPRSFCGHKAIEFPRRPPLGSS